MIKRIISALLLTLLFTACTPRIGVGIGGFAASGDTVAASEVHTDTESGVHGSVGVGTTIGL